MVILIRPNIAFNCPDISETMGIISKFKKIPYEFTNFNFSLEQDKCSSCNASQSILRIAQWKTWRHRMNKNYFFCFQVL